MRFVDTSVIYDGIFDREVVNTNYSVIDFLDELEFKDGTGWNPCACVCLCARVRAFVYACVRACVDVCAGICACMCGHMCMYARVPESMCVFDVLHEISPYIHNNVNLRRSEG